MTLPRDLTARLQKVAAMTLTMSVAAAGWPAPRSSGSHATARAHENLRKAVMVARVTSFVRWPVDIAKGWRESELVIAVLGDAHTASILRRLPASEVGLEQRTVIRVTQSSEALTDSHVVFIGRRHSAKVDSVLQAIGDQPILTFGDTEGLGERGVAVNLIDDQGGIRIEVNRAAMRRARLRPSYHLLRIAHFVSEEPAVEADGAPP